MMRIDARRARAALLALIPLLVGWDWLTTTDPDVDDGNESYRAQDYQAALEAYRRAHDGDGDRSRIRLAIGAATYKLAMGASSGEERSRMLEEAEIAFRRAAESEEPGVRASAYHNLGNALFERGKYEEAGQAYRRALKIEPHRDDSRFNLELVLRKRPPAPPPASGQGGSPQPNSPGQPGSGGQGSPDSGGDQPGQDRGSQGPAEPVPQADESNPATESAEGGAHPGADAEQGSQPGGSGEHPEQKDEESQGDGQGESPDQKPDQESDQKEPGTGDADDGNSGGADSDDWGPKSEAERKLDALERRSRELRKRRLRSGSRGVGNQRLDTSKDW